MISIVSSLFTRMSHFREVSRWNLVRLRLLQLFPHLNCWKYWFMTFELKSCWRQQTPNSSLQLLVVSPLSSSCNNSNFVRFQRKTSKQDFSSSKFMFFWVNSFTVTTVTLFQGTSCYVVRVAVKWVVENNTCAGHNKALKDYISAVTAVPWLLAETISWSISQTISKCESFTHLKIETLQPRV